jgi:hypothetical protein
MTYKDSICAYIFALFTADSWDEQLSYMTIVSWCPLSYTNDKTSSPYTIRLRLNATK